MFNAVIFYVVFSDQILLLYHTKIQTPNLIENLEYTSSKRLALTFTAELSSKSNLTFTESRFRNTRFGVSEITLAGFTTVKAKHTKWASYNIKSRISHNDKHATFIIRKLNNSLFSMNFQWVTLRR